LPNRVSGYITLREAITRVAVRRAPAADVRGYLHPPYPGPPSDIPGIHPIRWERAPEGDPFLRPVFATGLRLDAWEALEDARRALHDALAAGKLTVFVRDAANVLQPVPAVDWHARCGHDLIRTGTAGGYPIKHDPAFINEAAFAEWLWKRPPAGSAPGTVALLPDTMTLMQAAAWLMLRNASAASAAPSRAELERAWTAAGPGPDFAGALAALLDFLRDGLLPSFASTAADETAISARQWRTIMPGPYGAGLAAFEAKPESCRGRPTVALPVVPRAELLELWPPMPLPPIETPEPTMPPPHPAPATPQLLPYSAAIYRLAFGISGDPIKASHTWGVPPDPWAVDALAARAAGHPWRPAEPPPQPAWTYRAAVRRLLRSEEARRPGNGDPVLQLNYAREVAELYTAQRAAVLDAERHLTAAIRDGELPAFGVKVDTPNATQWRGPHVPIPPEVLALPGRIIRVNGALCAGGASLDDFGPPNCGPYFCDVFVDSKALRRLDPPDEAPDGGYIRVWPAITWRAFGRAGPRNLGSRPESLREPRLDYFEDWEEHALRLGGWAAIIVAEEELKALLLSGRVTAYGRREGAEADGQPTYKPVGPHVAIPPETFLNDKWAFEPQGCMHEFPWDRVTVTNGNRIQRELYFFDVRIAWPALATAWEANIVREEPPVDEEGPVLTPQSFPDAALVSPWVATSWRAFGTLNTPPHLIAHRSFENGTDRLPDETAAEYSARQDDHKRFDTAEREVLGLLASRQVKAEGQPPAQSKSGEKLYVASTSHVVIPASTFLNQHIAFGPEGELIHRKPSLERLYPSADLKGSDADPRFPLYHNVLIEAAGLRGAWGVTEATTVAPAEPMPASKPAPTQEYSRKTLAAWFILRVKSWRSDVAPPSEKADYEAACAMFGEVPRDPFREIRREKTPENWRKPGPRRPPN